MSEAVQSSLGDVDGSFQPGYQTCRAWKLWDRYPFRPLPTFDPLDTAMGIQTFLVCNALVSSFKHDEGEVNQTLIERLYAAVNKKQINKYVIHIYIYIYISV